jgi:hypothetical protein
MATVPLCADAAKAFASDLPAPLVHALAVAAKKPAADCRADLAPGRYDIDAAVAIRGQLVVGEDSVTASSVTPQADQLLALVLAKLNTATREKLLHELPAEFAANGNEMPATDESLVEAVREMLTKLRRRVTRPRRGSVRGSFDLAAVPSIVLQKLSVVG